MLSAALPSAPKATCLEHQMTVAGLLTTPIRSKIENFKTLLEWLENSCGTESDRE